MADEFQAALDSMPWRLRVVLKKIAEEGATFAEAGKAAGVTCRCIRKWRARDSGFNALVAEARELGKEKRTHLLWLRHPFRGKRPPRKGGAPGGYPKPRFAFGR